MNEKISRLSHLDALKAAASQLIVLHHLAFYGPMSDAAGILAPDLLGWLSNHARIAVQVFLVIGGYLAARSLAPQGQPAIERPLALVWNRYLRLVMPYLAALGLAILGALIARAWASVESAPAPASLKQVLAHLFLMQNLLGYEALTAGVWYVAIDFQLYALMVLLLCIGQGTGAMNNRFRIPSLALVSVLTLASLYHFNLDSAWDDWALYFFGAYGLGALAYWASRQQSGAWLAIILFIGIGALAVDFRVRIAAALLTALLLGCAGRWGGAGLGWIESRPLAFLGRISYSLFLVHYPVCLVINAAFARYVGDAPLPNAFGLFLAWGGSIVAAALFHRHVEQPSGTWLVRLAGRRLALEGGPAR